LASLEKELKTETPQDQRLMGFCFEGGDACLPAGRDSAMDFVTSSLLIKCKVSYTSFLRDFYFFEGL
jgi:hypothetical protein